MGMGVGWERSTDCRGNICLQIDAPSDNVMIQFLESCLSDAKDRKAKADAAAAKAAEELEAKKTPGEKVLDAAQQDWDANDVAWRTAMIWHIDKAITDAESRTRREISDRLNKLGYFVAATHAAAVPC